MNMNLERFNKVGSWVLITILAIYFFLSYGLSRFDYLFYDNYLIINVSFGLLVAIFFVLNIMVNRRKNISVVKDWKFWILLAALLYYVVSLGVILLWALSGFI